MPVFCSIFGYMCFSGLDLFVDATFACAPHPFYQCLIIVIYDHSTSSYVPIVYMLMSHKTEALYWHAFSQLVVLSNWKIDVRTYCSDFEPALMKELDIAFKGYGGVSSISNSVGVSISYKSVSCPRKSRKRPCYLGIWIFCV